MTHKTILSAVIKAMVLSTTTATLAQETDPGATVETAAPLTADTVTDAKVEAFVKAVIALESLRRQYTQRIGNAESEEAQNELRAEADSVAIQLVDKVRGITAEEYLAITLAAQGSESLTKRISAQVEVMRAQKAAFEKQQAEARKARDAQRAEETKKAAEDTAEEAAKSE